MKSIVFHIMITFRWLFMTTSKILSALMIFVLIFYVFNDASNQAVNLIITFMLAVIFGAFSWYYDVLLEKLESQNNSH